MQSPDELKWKSSVNTSFDALLGPLILSIEMRVLKHIASFQVDGVDLLLLSVLLISFQGM